MANMTVKSNDVSSAPRASRLTVGVTLIGIGILLVFITGFAHPQVLHDAAHDSRHALSFPCH